MGRKSNGEESALTFTFYELLWYFTVYSFLGWCMEVVFCTVTTGKLVNRGFLNGPVCPIYGFGMVIVLVTLGRFADHLWLLFFGGMVLTSALELVGGWALKKFFHTTWWDYSDEPFNIGGYICLKFSIAWGFCVVAAVRVLHAAVETLVHWIPFPLGVVFISILMAYFLTDTLITVLTIRKLNRSLSVINDVAARLRRESDAISNGLGRLTLLADEKLAEQKQELTEKAAAGRSVLEERLSERREQLQEQRSQMLEKYGERRTALEKKRTQVQRSAEELRAQWLERTSKMQRRMQRRLLRAFPDMRNERDGDALHRVRMWMEEARKK